MIIDRFDSFHSVGLAAHQSTQERAAVLAQRMRLQLGGSVGPTSSMTSSSLAQLEHHNAQPGEKHIYVGWQVRCYLLLMSPRR